MAESMLYVHSRDRRHGKGPRYWWRKAIGWGVDAGIVSLLFTTVAWGDTLFSQSGEILALALGIVLAIVRLVREWIEYRTIQIEES